MLVSLGRCNAKVLATCATGLQQGQLQQFLSSHFLHVIFSLHSLYEYSKNFFLLFYTKTQFALHNTLVNLALNTQTIANISTQPVKDTYFYSTKIDND